MFVVNFEELKPTKGPKVRDWALIETANAREAIRIRVFFIVVWLGQVKVTNIKPHSLSFR
jgi:hypothetical protein